MVAGTEIEQFLFEFRNWHQKKFDARRLPDGTTHAPDSGVDFMAPVSGACLWLKKRTMKMTTYMKNTSISVFQR